MVAKKPGKRDSRESGLKCSKVATTETVLRSSIPYTELLV